MSKAKKSLDKIQRKLQRKVKVNQKRRVWKEIERIHTQQIKAVA